MENILNLNFDEFQKSLVAKGYKPFRANIIAGWIYQKSVFDFDNMTDISKKDRPLLADTYKILRLKESKRMESKNSESIKFLFETEDGLFIETVLLLSVEKNNKEAPNRRTVCVSSQIGCALDCKFCATGQMGFTRNLQTSEMISQVLLIDSYAKTILPDHDTKSRAITNVVFMGMGEPMLNYDNVLKTVRILNSPKFFNLGMRHITISTAGIIPGILKLAKDNNQVRLAISLNSMNQEKRLMLMPITAKHSTKQLIEAIREYQDITNRRVTFEYVLIHNVNDKENDVIAIKRALYQMKYSLNLIAYNPVDSIPFERPSKREIENFENFLKKHTIPYIMRYSKGNEINAGCGQLITRQLEAEQT